MKTVELVPYPVHLKEGSGFLPCREAVVCSEPFFADRVSLVCDLLTVAGLKCFPSQNHEPTDGGISITVAKDSTIENPEAYLLDITSSGIFIGASSCSGAFYAFQTLRQLVMTYGSNLPQLSIYDEPAFSWRGFMIDTCRSFYPVTFLEKMIDAAAFHKMNRFHWHLTDDQGWRLPVPEYPLLTEIGSWRVDHRLSDRPEKVCGGESRLGYYTDEEIKHLVHYAAQRSVTVIPEIEVPGHASALLASYPGLGCTGGPYSVEDRWGIFPDAVCPGNDAVFPLFEAVFDTVCRLFPGQWVHIGGDECLYDKWKACPRCQSRMKQEGLTSEAQLQAWMTVKIARMLEVRGKTAIGWDEVLEGTEQLGLPSSLVVQSWRGTTGGKKAAQLRHQAIMSPQNDGCYFDHKNYDDPSEPGRLGTNTVRSAYEYCPAPSGADYAPFILGGECALWTEAVPWPKLAEYMLFPRMSAFSEAVWLSARYRDFNRFCAVLPAHKKRLAEMNILFYPGKLE